MGTFVLWARFRLRCLYIPDTDSMNRNIGVLQTTIAELITVKEHQRKSMTTCMAGTATNSSFQPARTR